MHSGVSSVFYIACTFKGRPVSTKIFVREVEAQIQIVQCNLKNSAVSLNIGHDGAISSVSSLAHLTVNDSNISGKGLNIGAVGRKSIGIVQISNATFSDSSISARGPHIACFIDNCNFVKSPLFFSRFRILFIVNSKFDAECQKNGCALELVGSSHVAIGMSRINLTCNLFQFKSCYGIYLGNTELIHSKIGRRLILIKGNHALIENCSFLFHSELKFISQNLFFEEFDKSIQLINVVINETNIRNALDIPLIRILTAKFKCKNVLLYCPEGYKVVQKTLGNIDISNYICQDPCQNDEYSVIGSSKLTSEGHEYSPKNRPILMQIFPSCYTCPVGVLCQEKIIPLPNYWGYKTEQVINVLRCPEDYCCQGNKSCLEIDSCKEHRTGILCGQCNINMTESVFSANCIPSASCKSGAIITMYILPVIVYSVGLMLLDIVKDKFNMCFNRIKRKLKNKVGKNRYHKPAENRKNETQETHVKDDSMKYLQILFYYVQDASLFKVHLAQLGGSNDRILLKMFQWSPESIIKMYSGISNMCFPLTTAITKILFKCTFDPCVILFLFLIYVGQMIIVK